MFFFKSIVKTLKNVSPLKIAVLLLVLLIICSVMNINIMPKTIEGLDGNSEPMKHFIHRYINLLEKDVVTMCSMPTPSFSDVSTNTVLENMVLYLNTANSNWKNNVCIDSFEDQDSFVHNITSEEEWTTFLDVSFEDILTSEPRGCVYLNILRLELENRGIQSIADIDALDDDTIREMGGNSSMGSWAHLMENIIFSDNSVEDSFRYWLNNEVYQQKCTGYESYHRDHNETIDDEIIRIEEWWGDDHPSMDLNRDGLIGVIDLLQELTGDHPHIGGGR